MIEITRWPCVIIAAPRTGSNVLAASISTDLEPYQWHIPHQPDLGHRCFYEPNESPSIWAVYQSAIAHHDTQFVVKIMSDQTSLYRDILDKDSFKIRLYRKDTVGQIASFYIADQRDQWYHRSWDVQDQYSIDIKMPELAQAADIIIHSNIRLEHTDMKFDITLSYESLGDMHNAYHARTRRPDNLAQLRSAIAELLDIRGIAPQLSLS